jgi:hypothetical protein
MLFPVYPIDRCFAIKNSYNLTIPMKQEKENKKIYNENTKYRIARGQDDW